MQNQTNISPAVLQNSETPQPQNFVTRFPAFSDAVCRHHIDPRRLHKFFNGFSEALRSSGTSFPDHETANGEYYDSISAALAMHSRLPGPVRTALLTLETAALPENAARLDDAIQRRIPNVSLHGCCPIDCALELWFLVPDELRQFEPQAAAGSVQGSGFRVQGSVPAAVPRGPLLPECPRPLTQPSPRRRGSASADADAETFASLARLGPAEYDRCRRAEAKRLHLRIETLDTQVAKYRAELDLQAQANAVRLPAIELWPEPVNGAEVLDQVSSRYGLYLVLPSGAPDAMCLWTAHSHAIAAFHLSPRLSLYSPKPGCGKTTAFDVITTMVPRPLRTENISAPVLFRLVDQHQPTLLLDEVDAYLHQSEELRGLLNAGHKRGACAYRCEGEGKAVRAFHAFAPAALAGIGSLPATLRDRSVLVPLVAAAEGQIATRFDPLRTEVETILARKLARWAADNFDALAACNPPLPPGAFNRLADNWRPLFAIAQIAGGDWPARALDAFTKLRPTPSALRNAPCDDTTLLADIRQLFTQSGSDRMTSEDLVDSLCALADRPYSQPSSINHQPTKLARLLATFGVRSRSLRVGDRCVRGYQLADFGKEQ